MHRLRIATRQSPLAWQQAETVKQQLQQHYPELRVELIGFTTQGDRLLDVTLNKIGGKGLFVKELEQALLEGKADIAVHSVKDLPAQLPEELVLAAVCQRHQPHDVLVSNYYHSLIELPKGACIGTSSLRRQAQLKAVRSDLTVQPLRGNIHTRLRKLDAGDYAAIVLAAAGLLRMQMEGRISSYLSFEHCLPAVGQGALGIECLANNEAVLQLVAVLQHMPTYYCIKAERAVSQRLGGSCQVPIAAFATLDESGSQLTLRARVGQPDGSQILEAKRAGLVDQANEIGLQVADDLLMQGAEKIIRALQ